MLPRLNPKTPRQRMSDEFKFKIYEWAEWLAKIALVAICGLLWQLNLDVQRSLQIQNSHEREIAQIKADMRAMMSRDEALEMMKRVEQQLEIIVLQRQLERAQK